MIDWARVRALRDEVGADEFEEVVDLFLQEVEGMLDTLTPGAGCAELEEILHAVKGSALTLGFAELGNLCGTGEAKAAGGATEGIAIDDIIHCFDASRAVFLRDLGAALTD